MPRRRPSLHKRVHNYLLPHKGNKYSPQIFAYSSVLGVIAVLILLQGIYLLDTKVSFKGTSFLASVLPGALISLTNADRASQNLGTLTPDPLLEQAAQLKANDMAAKGYFAHVTPEGYQPWHWFDAVGYNYEYAGENLAVNFTDSSDVEAAWMNSPTHHANIVKPQYTKIGIATADGMYEGKEVTFVVQFFAKPAESAPHIALAPVVHAATIAAAPAEPVKTVAVAVQPLAPQTRVLGAETNTSVGFVAQVAASPLHALIYILSGLAAFFALLLLIAFFVHLRVAYVEALGGGVALLLIIIGFLIWNALQLKAVEVPQGSAETASVAR